MRHHKSDNLIIFLAEYCSIEDAIVIVAHQAYIDDSILLSSKRPLIPSIFATHRNIQNFFPIFAEYSFRRNLLKTASMEVGQVSYHDKTKVKRMRVEKDNAIVNNLNRTKEV